MGTISVHEERLFPLQICRNINTFVQLGEKDRENTVTQKLFRTV